jgi:hypothetical protein
MQYLIVDISIRMIDLIISLVYIPCNADVAGLMTRTNIVAYPWFSPAGQQRGILNNAIKLAYNPNPKPKEINFIHKELIQS